MMNWEQPKVYAVKHMDEIVRAASRSGGIFTAISDYALENDGVVYGCILTENFKAVHIRTEDQAGRDKMRGSKYIQSRIGDTFQSVKSDLESDRKVLFTGTSCQIAGLKGYLGKEYDNLLCVDIVCHGVPSPKVWKRYLEWQEAKSDSNIVTVDFRNKKDFGWRTHVETLCFGNGQTVNSKIFTTLFYGHMILRPSCYECPFKSVMHPGDITIADYWGIEKAAPQFDDNKGVSLVLINNNRGEEIFNGVKERIKWQETRIEDSMQSPLVAPFPEPVNRRDFWSDFNCKEFDYIAKRYGGAGIKNKIRNVLRLIWLKFKSALRKINRKLIKI